MDFLNDLGKKFTQAARSVQAFTRESTESTRLSSALRDARDELDSLYAELGRACYEQHTRPESEIPADLFDRVRAALERVDELSARRERRARCPGCGAVQPIEARFCSNCGRRMPEDAPAPIEADDEDGQYCPECGAMRRDDADFCAVCGHSFVEAPAPEFPAPEVPDAPDPTRPELLETAQAASKSIMFEAQLGALRDINYGIYPFTSSSSPLAANAPVGCGLPSLKVDEVIGVTKAYSTCVGEGPFVGELDGQAAHDLREAGAEYGAATGRPRRVAWMDIVATRYGTKLQGATALALTKMDVLSYLDEIPVCVAYRLRGETIDRFPYTPDLYDCEPVYETLPGWKCDISGARRFEDLPKAAQDYVKFIEARVGCPIAYVSVGAERDALILRG